MKVQLQREVEEDDGNIGKVICPRFPIDKTEGWWLVVGDRARNTLLSIKRLAIGVKSTVYFFERYFLLTCHRLS